jgi:hypothetical protein
MHPSVTWPAQLAKLARRQRTSGLTPEKTRRNPKREKVSCVHQARISSAAGAGPGVRGEPQPWSPETPVTSYVIDRMPTLSASVMSSLRVWL